MGAAHLSVHDVGGAGLIWKCTQLPVKLQLSLIAFFVHTTRQHPTQFGAEGTSVFAVCPHIPGQVLRYLQQLCALVVVFAMPATGPYIDTRPVCLVCCFPRWPADHTYSSSQAVSICTGLASALAYLHSRGVCHGEDKDGGVCVCRVS